MSAMPPAPDALPAPAPRPDWDGFLRERLAAPAPSVQRHEVQGVQVWLKRAAPARGPGRHRAQALLARLLRLPVLRPVPVPGGAEAIATEVRRLRGFAALGLRVPEVLAAQADGFLMRDLGRPGEETHSLGNEIDHAVPHGPGAVLALWRQGLAAIDAVHAHGACLSQAFARNLVRCPDGVVGYLDFEDDPAAALPLPVCQARDLLCYAQSTALYLREAGALDTARAELVTGLTTRDAALRAVMEQTVRRLTWLRRLPQDRRWGRDLQRVRAAYDLLAP